MRPRVQIVAVRGGHRYALTAASRTFRCRMRSAQRHFRIFFRLHARASHGEDYIIDMVRVHLRQPAFAEVHQHLRNLLDQLRADVLIGLGKVPHEIRSHEVLFESDLA